MSKIGKVMAQRLNQAKGNTEILIPLKGASIYGSKGDPYMILWGVRCSSRP
jgi:uncharacterized protein (UPF0261 family)